MSPHKLGGPSTVPHKLTQGLACHALSGKKKVSICNVSFSNFGFGLLVNGWPDDPIKDRPFDFHFTAESILRSHIAVGFMPMMGRANLDPKV